MSSQAELTFALSPFDYDSAGDCILQSSDGIHFKVIRQFLVTASTVFADMFAVGSVPTNDGSLPIVALTEHSNVLKALLTMLYPTDIPKPSTTDLWQSPDMLSAAPAQMYGLAWRLKMQDEVVIASRYTHKESFENLANVVPLQGLVALMDLKERRHDAIEAFLLQLRAQYNLLCSTHQSNMKEQFLALRRKAQSAFSAPYPQCKDLVSFLGMQIGVDPCSMVQGQLLFRPSCHCFSPIPLNSISQEMATLLSSFPYAVSPPSF
ncbi:hypothetical protein FRC05_007238 [Tulasnella sp. 425]|nr:hypothetical protein FRC05_007238 [Tulasnella sp. 425]